MSNFLQSDNYSKLVSFAKIKSRTMYYLCLRLYMLRLKLHWCDYNKTTKNCTTKP